MEKSIQKLAQEARKYFIQRERDNGDIFITCTNDRPQWVQDLVFAAHADMMPDDYRYRFIFEAIDYIADHDDVDYPDEMEADIYTSDLTAWLHSRNDRVDYLTEAMNICDFSKGFDLLSAAQLMEKTEVYHLVLRDLYMQLESFNDDDDE